MALDISPFSGSYSEYTYKLQTYGIPSQHFPMDENGNVLLANHWDWLERQRIQESSGNPATAIIPRRFDVLLGKGTTIAEHTGNLRAFHIVEMNRDRYEKASKFEKTHVSERIVHLIHESYGRFLKKEDGGWVECTKTEAREKISHCFRRLRELDAKRAKKSKATKRETATPGGGGTSNIVGNDSGIATAESGKRPKASIS